MKWLAKRRPKLTPELAAKRPKWAKERENWTAEEFEGVIWRNECSVETSDDHTKSGYSEHGLKGGKLSA